MSKELFYPNDLKPVEVDSLQDWQLLVAALHFAPTMGDCVICNFSYFYRDGNVWVDDDGRETDLVNDIDLQHPFECINRHFAKKVQYEDHGIKYEAKITPVDWKVFSADFLKLKAVGREVAKAELDNE